jgi:hypothetical protein
MNRPLLEFDGNTVHSSSYHWFDAGCIYVGESVLLNSKHNRNRESLFRLADLSAQNLARRIR